MRLIALLFLLQSSMSTARDDGPLSADDMHHIRQRLIRSLGLTRVPDISQVNITDEEKAEAYGLYFARLKENENQRLDQEDDEDDDEEDDEIEEKMLSFNASAVRIKRSSSRHKLSKKIKALQSKAEIFIQPTRSGKIDCNKESKKKCCRHRMYVNFTHLRMDFVVEPKGFEAYYCKGKCPRLYNPAHAHALIQSTMNARGINVKIPKPCCAPSKLSNLTIMHYDENRKLKVTDWTNAVVEECACS
uniref:TGF-beta family profile domain-containing protein n=1 Tax=Strigamia maritima TaxID=126957 RepID=T1JF94_STRMM